MALYKFIDIGANLTDPMYQGLYHGTRKHEADLDQVLMRAWKNGVDKIIVTGTSLDESSKALELANSSDKLYCTVGCHPTRCTEFTAGSCEEYYNGLLSLIKNNRSKVVAIGELGLDYDRTQFCDIETQKKFFSKQLNMISEINLPLFLHCRNSARDLVEILDGYTNARGVIHSFDGSQEEAEMILDKGFSIGINGCSLKTAENLKVAAMIPNDRLMLETDAPWCEVKPTHAGFKYVSTTFSSVKKEKWQPNNLIKSRNEPVTIIHILEILAAIKDTDPKTLCHQLYQNTMKLFFPNS